MAQQSLTSRRQRGHERRSGLAPLELVAALPVLLFVAALIVNFGALAAWRVRGEIVARDQAWRARRPRTGANEAPSAIWPAGATSDLIGGPQILALAHPELQHAVVRGPLPHGFFVEQLLDPARGYYQGRASVTRRFPMLSRLGPYVSGNIRHPLLDQKWPGWEMGIPNVHRRSLRLYGFPVTDQRLPQHLANTRDSMLSMPNYGALLTLERDSDVYRYHGRYVDFHPRIPHPYSARATVIEARCELDGEIVRTGPVARLVDALDEEGRAELRRISRLPRRMTDFFWRLYDTRVRRLERRIEAWSEELSDRYTRLPRRRELREMIAEAQSELNRIQPYLEPLEAYRARLDEIEDQLRAEVEARFRGEDEP